MPGTNVTITGAVRKNYVVVKVIKNAFRTKLCLFLINYDAEQIVLRSYRKETQFRWNIFHLISGPRTNTLPVLYIVDKYPTHRGMKNNIRQCKTKMGLAEIRILQTPICLRLVQWFLAFRQLIIQGFDSQVFWNVQQNK